MKKLLALIILTITVTSCKDFLDRKPTTSVEDTLAMQNASDVQNVMMGLHSTMRNPAYYGKNFLVLGDIAADLVTKQYAITDNRFSNIEMYTITDNQAELGELWAIMYRVCDRSARVITSAKPLLAGATASEARILNAALGQAYTMKALTHFNLVNLFALPYTGTQQDQLNAGVILVGDRRIEAQEKPVRSSVAHVYQQILKDLDSAMVYFAKGSTLSFTQMNWPAAYGIEARVRLFMKDYAGAEVAAQAAITKRRGSMARSAESLVSMWESLTASTEDLFVLTINKAEDFGTESINNLYRSYGARLSPTAVSKLDPLDWRRAMLTEIRTGEYNTKKFTSATTLNKLPVIRLAEMYLILAECANETNRLTVAQQALLNVASRNPNMVSIESLPQDQSGLRLFIQEERMREFSAEGYRWMDLRRCGLTLNRPTGTSLKPLNNYEVYKFCYPIPQTEINASGILQNRWSENLPR